MIVDVQRSNETREAVGGATSGVKLQRYTVQLNVYHMAWMEHSEDAGADVNLLSEAILDHIRADRTLGGICSQAGESPRGITTSRPRPKLDGDKTLTDFQISFDVDVHIIA